MVMGGRWQEEGCVALIYEPRQQGQTRNFVRFRISIPFDSISGKIPSRPLAGKSLTATWHLRNFFYRPSNLPSPPSVSGFCAPATPNCPQFPGCFRIHTKFSSWPKVTWHAYKLSAIKFALTFWPCFLTHRRPAEASGPLPAQNPLPPDLAG